MSDDLRHMRLEHDEQGIAWLTLDVAGASANTLSSEVIGELEQVLADIEEAPPPGLVIRSGKNGFIAGADVTELSQIDTPEQSRALIERGQRLFNRLADLPHPTVALIRGHCLGGGLELALACRYRIADSGPETRLGLPEVQIGIHPGFGGTARLPDLIGPLAALDLIFSGRSISARTARRLGLIDHALTPWQLENAAGQLVHTAPTPRRARAWQRALCAEPARRGLRPVLERRLRARVRREHYPAPYAALDLWARTGGDSLAGRLNAERDSLVRLVEDERAGNLMRVFALRERLKREARRTELSLPDHIHVVGAGTMGGDIAAWMALQGYRVTLADERPDAIAATLRRARALFERRLVRPARVTAALDRLIPDPAGQGVVAARLVIEAIVEDRAAKLALYRSLEPRMRADAVLATNTSSLPLEDLSEALAHPGRLIGLHFFNPVARMPLVEVVAGAGSEGAALERGQAVIAAAGKLPLRVKSGPGFLVNRLLMPYLLRAARLHEEGTAREQIDQAARGFGMPMGPLELADSVGLDVCLAAADVIGPAYGFEVPPDLRRRVERGELGCKSGRGYYEYDRRGQPGRVRARHDAAMLERLGHELLAPLLDEAERCRDEGVVADTDLVDAGAIFGTGFAPFTGGPLHYRGQQWSGITVEAPTGATAGTAA